MSPIFPIVVNEADYKQAVARYYEALYAFGYSLAFKDAPTESPVFNEVGDMATASWRRGGKTYVFASKGGNQLDLMKWL